MAEAPFLLVESGLQGSAGSNNLEDSAFPLFACSQFTVLCNLACNHFNG